MATSDATLGYKVRLRADFPDMPITSTKVIGEGWDHTAIEVNDSIIFRIPRSVYAHPELSSRVRYETAILKHLSKNFPVAVPDPKYIAPNYTYFGYPKLSGELVMDLLPSFNAADNAHLKEDWVIITDTLHRQIMVDQAMALGVPTFSCTYSLSNVQKIYQLTRLDGETKAFVDRVVKRAAKINVKKERQVFIHNDLHFMNMLADPVTKRITGVIDWSDVRIAPLAREFSIWEWTHDNSLEMVAALYEARTGIKVDVAQARLWKHLEELSDFVEQMNSGDTDGAQRSMGHIRQWVQEGHWREG